MKEEGRRKKEEGRRKKDEGRGKKEEGRRKREGCLSSKVLGHCNYIGYNRILTAAGWFYW
jgi:hypothetical protein